MSVSDEIKQQREKVKKMDRKAKFDYFMDYYKVPVLIAIFVIICAVAIIHSMVNNKPYAFYAIAVNSSPAEDTEGNLQNDFAAYSGIDTNEYNCFIDTASTLNFDGSSQYDIATEQKLMAVIATSELDVIIGDQAVFDQYVSNESFSDLRDYFSQSELDAISDKLYYVDRAVLEADVDASYTDSASTTASTDAASASDSGASYESIFVSEETSVVSKDEFVKPDPAEMEDPVPVGIIVSDSAELTKYSAYSATIPVAGIVSNSQHTEKAVEFMKFLMQ